MHDDFFFPRESPPNGRGTGFFYRDFGLRKSACRIEGGGPGIQAAARHISLLEREVSSHDRIRRQQMVLQAEGYLELGMPRHALDVLARFGHGDSLPDHALYLQGEGLRALGLFREALAPLSRAAQGSPNSVHIWLALGWCHKRTGRIDLAIESLEEALAVEPNDALVNYNLACYWSVAGNKRQALIYLSRSFDLREHYRALVGSEPDFDAIRSDPSFQALMRVTV
jgi:tetratricopeptide (TPR) repeat protein